jgi:hypothetical protein
VNVCVPLNKLVLDQTCDSQVLERLGSQFDGLGHRTIEFVCFVFFKHDVDTWAHRIDFSLFVDQDEGTRPLIEASDLHINRLLASVLESVLNFTDDGDVVTVFLLEGGGSGGELGKIDVLHAGFQLIYMALVNEQVCVQVGVLDDLSVKMRVLFPHKLDSSSHLISAQFLDNRVEVARQGVLVVDELGCLNQEIIGERSNFRVCDAKHKVEVWTVVHDCNCRQLIDW